MFILLYTRKEQDLNSGNESRGESDFLGGRKCVTKRSFVIVSLIKWGLGEVSKNGKWAKVGYVQPHFKDWAPFVVVKREGCGYFRMSESTISDRESKLLWYL